MTLVEQEIKIISINDVMRMIMKFVFYNEYSKVNYL